MNLKKEIIFVIGGCRSGKSRHALELGEKRCGKRNVFVATCTPHDEEMVRRIEKHQEERSGSWSTAEVPVELGETIRMESEKADVMLVDCLTLWVTNLLMENDDPDAMESRIQELTRALENAKCPVILVSNEVGAGIVPENRLARAFRDICGFTNQRVAACATKVVWTVAGIPVTIKEI